jgi:hypothetical protein
MTASSHRATPVGRAWILLGCLTAAVLVPVMGVAVWALASGGSRPVEIAYLLLEMAMLQAAAVLVGVATGVAVSAGIALIAPRGERRMRADTRFWAILLCSVSCAIATATLAVLGMSEGLR